MSGTNSIARLKTNLESYIYNPVKVVSGVFDLLEEISNGDITIVDPTNPFVTAIECAAVMAMSAVDENQSYNRKQYSRIAVNQDELYLHMSDVDYINRFATPANTKITLVFSVDELENNFVKDNILGISKIVIPRNSTFTISETDFSLQYPIEIRKMSHGGYQVVYDGDIVSPLLPLVTNVIDFDFKNNQDGRWLVFEVDVQQFNIITKNLSPNAATGTSTTIVLDDQFYYCRVYTENIDKTWTEISVTHTPDIFDINVPTAVVRVNDVDKTVTIDIPQIYTTKGVINSTVRVDVYQTKGALNMVLSNYSPSDFIAKWITIDTSESTLYSSPLDTFRSLIIFSDKTVSSGSSAISIDELRKRIINNSVGNISLPITSDQLNTKFSINGYDIVKNIDVITNRKFLATKNLPVPTADLTKVPASALITILETKMDRITSMSGSLDNGTRVTITPDALFKLNNSQVTHLTNDEVNYLKSLAVEQRALVVNQSDFLYSPFHYVLDASGNEFEIRPYYLDSPKITSKQYINENDTSLVSVTIDTYSIEKTETGYSIYILTKSGETFQNFSDNEIYVQLGFIPVGDIDRAYVLGTLKLKKDNERLYEFKIETNFDLDSNDSLIVNNFNMYTLDSLKVALKLTSNFDVFFTTTADLGTQYVAGDIEDKLGIFQLPNDIKAIKHEQITIKVGSALKTLWAGARTVVTPNDYRRYDVDVAATYSADIFQTDPLTGSILIIDAGGNVTYNKLHSKDDVVLDSDGNTIYLHKAGDIMLDSNNEPIIKSQRVLSRYCDIFFIDGIFWFGTTDSVKAYKAELANSLVSWLTNDLEDINKILLEQSDVFFYPKVTIGTINIYTSDNVKTTIDAQQSFTVNIYVSETVYNDSVLRAKLEDSTITTITSYLNNVKISTSDIISALKSAYGTDTLGVSLSGLGGSHNYDVITIVDDISRCSIGKRLTSLANGNLTVTEDININFVKHVSN